VDPPWEEYTHRAPGITDHLEYWNVEDIMNLKIEVIPFYLLILTLLGFCFMLWE
jgi:hypothetical protein